MLEHGNGYWLLRRGGDRRSGDGNRQTWQLTECQCLALLNAAQEAIDVRQPFNRCVTITWGRFGVADADNRKVTEIWLRNMRRWAASRGFRLRYIGVQEWGEINKAHVHLLLHIAPENLPEFGMMRLPSKYAKKAIHTNVAPNLTDCDQLYPPSTREADNGVYEAKLFSILHYFLKSAPCELERKLGLSGWGAAKWGQKSLCYGKRIFISQA